MTLREMKINGTCLASGINLRHDTARRLGMLGLTMGTPLTLLNKKRSGAVIVKLRGTRVALGKEIADGIDVVPTKPEGETNNA